MNFIKKKLSEKAGVSSQMINDIEGCRRWPSKTTLIKIADCLQIDVYELFLPIQIEEDDSFNLRHAIKEKIVKR